MKRLTQFHVEHFCYAPKRMESLFSKEQFALGVFCFFLIMDRNADGMFFVVFPPLVDMVMDHVGYYLIAFGIFVL